jgi:hypothetical protein
MFFKAWLIATIGINVPPTRRNLILSCKISLLTRAFHG